LLASFTYKEGIGALKDSTLLKDINSGKMNKVRDDLSLWNKVTDPKTSGKVVSQGLINRRTSEADRFEGCR
jgi:GH24 family phage-related lysozyme (muramidase)